MAEVNEACGELHCVKGESCRLWFVGDVLAQMQPVLQGAGLPFLLKNFFSVSDDIFRSFFACLDRAKREHRKLASTLFLDS